MHVAVLTGQYLIYPYLSSCLQMSLFTCSRWLTCITSHTSRVSLKIGQLFSDTKSASCKDDFGKTGLRSVVCKDSAQA